MHARELAFENAAESRPVPGHAAFPLSLRRVRRPYPVGSSFGFDSEEGMTTRQAQKAVIHRQDPITAYRIGMPPVGRLKAHSSVNPGPTSRSIEKIFEDDLSIGATQDSPLVTLTRVPPVFRIEVGTPAKNEWKRGSKGRLNLIPTNSTTGPHACTHGRSNHERRVRVKASRGGSAVFAQAAGGPNRRRQPLEWEGRSELGDCSRKLRRIR